MQPADLARLRIPSDPQLHPDGDRVAFTLTSLDLDRDLYVRRIWLTDATGCRAFTSGPGDTSPRWSPKGDRLAFLRSGEAKDAKPQLAVMPVAGGEAEVLTSFELGVEDLVWAPDGSRICVVAVTWSEDWSDLGEEERRRRVRRITTFPYRYDNLGWLHDRHRHLWLVDPSGESEQRCLTSGSFDETYPRWHPSGERLAFISDREPRRGLVSGTDVWELDLGSGETTRAAPRGDWIMPSYRPDGVLHLIGHPQTDYPRNYGLWRREEDGYHDVGGHLDRSVYSIMLRTAGEPRWLGRSAFCPLEDGGRMKLVRLDPDGAAEALVDGDRVVTGIDAGGSGRLVFTASTGTDPGELWELVDGKERMLTDLRPKDLELQPIRHWTFPSGSHEIDAFAVLPLGEGPFPVLLNIHGGPATQYGFGFFDEFQVYAGAGFAVVACNPRGSAGRGLEFMRAVRGEGWGRVDLDDITALLVSALDRFPQLDRQRLGIMGGSYGGFLTAWTIAHDHRFRSAIVERALLSVPSFAGTSDIAVDFPPNYLESSDWVTWWEKSPLRLAHQVRTPTLIIHSEDDLRCPIEQAEQFFLALLRNQVEVELMRFPGEGHELSRSGKPRHRVERLKAVIDWHRRHLGQAVPN